MKGELQEGHPIFKKVLQHGTFYLQVQHSDHYSVAAVIMVCIVTYTFVC